MSGPHCPFFRTGTSTPRTLRCVAELNRSLGICLIDIEGTHPCPPTLAQSQSQCQAQSHLQRKVQCQVQCPSQCSVRCLGQGHEQCPVAVPRPTVGLSERSVQSVQAVGLGRRPLSLSRSLSLTVDPGSRSSRSCRSSGSCLSPGQQPDGVLYIGRVKPHPRPLTTSRMTERWTSKETHPRATNPCTSPLAAPNKTRRIGTDPSQRPIASTMS